MYVCAGCFNAKGLQRRIEDIEKNSDGRECTYHSNNNGVPVEEVAKILEDVILNYYSSSDRIKGTYDSGYTLLELLCDLPEHENHEMAEALQSALINNYRDPYHERAAFFSEDNIYEELPTDRDVHRFSLWTQFCEEIQGRQRFFNQKAQENLNKIFTGLHLLRDHDANSALITLPQHSTRLHRARLANSLQLCKNIKENTSREMGPPPKEFRTAGRMNSSGITAFYCAFEFDTCLAELRPAIGETLMAVQFQLLRDINVLDMTKFDAPPEREDLFAKEANKSISQWEFMSSFMREISRPCLPNDEHIDYIPTQVVAEYLIHLYGDSQTTIEGIIFHSAQRDKGKNLVLFGDATSVEYAAPVKNSNEPTFSSPPTLRVMPETLKTEKIETIRLCSINIDQASPSFEQFIPKTS